MTSAPRKALSAAARAPGQALVGAGTALMSGGGAMVGVANTQMEGVSPAKFSLTVGGSAAIGLGAVAVAAGGYIVHRRARFAHAMEPHDGVPGA